MMRESMEMEPVQKALGMEMGAGIFRKCLSELFSERTVGKPDAPDIALKSFDFPRFLRQRGNEIGWNTDPCRPFAGAVFCFPSSVID